MSRASKHDCDECESWLCYDCGGCFCPDNLCECETEYDDGIFDAEELGLDPEQVDLPVQEKRADA